MITIKTKADRIAMWVLIGLGLVQVFSFSVGFGYGFATALMGN